MFSLLPDDDDTPVTLLQMRELHRAGEEGGEEGRSDRDGGPVIAVSGDPVLVRQEDLDRLHRRLLEKEGRRLVMVAVPPSGW